MGMKRKTDQVSGPWGISVRTPTKSLMKVIPRDYPNESLRDVLTRTKEYARAIRNKYSHRDDVIVEVISRSHAFPKPSNVRITRRHELWCPYCGKLRKFKRNQLIELDGIEFISDAVRCTICQMSDADFWVRTYNNTWPIEGSGVSRKKKKG